MTEQIGKEILPDGKHGNAVCAVVVSFCPDLQRLRALVESVVTQAEQLVIVDNGSPAETLEGIRRLVDLHEVKLIEFLENRGIAAAHNAGIRHAMTQGYEYVLLLDHDSRLLPGCIAHLLQASRRLVAEGIRLAAVGPQYNDETSQARAPFWRYSRWGYHRIIARPEDEFVEASVLISSGSLISCATLQAIGLMEESLFIDGVDWEWCFRSASLGYRLFGVTAAVMQHSLGDGGLKVLGRILPLHGPLRHYYVYRNTVLMCRMTQIPFSWKWHFSLKLVIRFFLYLVLAPRRRERCRMIWQGLRDGIAGRSGRIASAHLEAIKMI